MNQREYDEGYKLGVASTIDQKRGARDAINDQKKKARENEESWKAAVNTHHAREENNRQLQESKREQERKKREYEQAQLQKRSGGMRADPPHTNKPIKSEWSNGAAITGFLICAVWAATQAQGLGGIIIAGLIGAVMMGQFYEVLIGFSILMMFLVGVANYI